MLCLLVFLALAGAIWWFWPKIKGWTTGDVHI